MPNPHFFILCHKTVMAIFAKGGEQVQAYHIALAVDDKEGVPSPRAIYRPVYIEFAGIAASAAAVVTYVAGALDST